MSARKRPSSELDNEIGYGTRSKRRHVDTDGEPAGQCCKVDADETPSSNVFAGVNTWDDAGEGPSNSQSSQPSGNETISSALATLAGIFQTKAITNEHVDDDDDSDTEYQPGDEYETNEDDEDQNVSTKYQWEEPPKKGSGNNPLKDPDTIDCVMTDPVRGLLWWSRRTSKWVRAVYHNDIRSSLLARACKSGALKYDHNRERGNDEYDQTAYHHDQRHWSSNPETWPDVMFLLERPNSHSQTRQSGELSKAMYEGDRIGTFSVVGLLKIMC